MSWRDSTLEEKRDDLTSETELRELFRRAEKNPDRKGSLRRAAFQRLLSLAQSSNPALKKLVTEKVKDFFADFPDLQEEAINAVYDLCEDQDQSVRILGYGAIASVSRVAKTWLLRNADVLVQLLQSDDEREVAVVKRALQEHVDLDPLHILQMLCEQCSFEAERLDDDEERALRSRLRKLVVDFLSEKYRGCVARVVKDAKVEKVVVQGLVQAIPRATIAERQKLINDILVHLPSFSSQSSTETFDIVLDICRSALQSDIASTPPGSRSDLKSTLPLLHFVSVLTSGSNASTPPSARRAQPATRPHETRLFDFYLSLVSPGGLLSGKTLEQSITSDSCIKFIDFYGMSYEKAEHPKHARVNENLDKQADSLIELFTILSAVISSPEATSRSIRLALTPALRLLRAIHKHFLGFKGPCQPLIGLRSDIQQLQRILSSTGPQFDQLEGKEGDDEVPTVEEVVVLRKNISDTIRSLDEAITEVDPPASTNELRIRGQSSVIGPGATKRRLDTEQGTPVPPSVLNVEQGLSVRGAARLLQASDAMDIDDMHTSTAPPARSEPPHETQSSQGYKRRRGESAGADETHSAAVTSAGAINPQQKMELPSLLSRLQGTSSSTAFLQASTSKQTSGSTLNGLANRLSPNNANATSNPSSILTPGFALSNPLYAKLGIPSSANSNWTTLSSDTSQTARRTTLSSDTSQTARSTAKSHDHSSKRPSVRSTVPTATGQPRKRFDRRGLSIQGAASLATDTSGSLNEMGDEIRIRGAAQRVFDDGSEGSDRRQVSLLARLGDAGGGKSGKSGVGTVGHRNRK